MKIAVAIRKLTIIALLIFFPANSVVEPQSLIKGVSLIEESSLQDHGSVIEPPEGISYNLQASNTDVQTRGLFHNGVSYISVSNPHSVQKMVVVNPQVRDWSIESIQVSGNLEVEKVWNLLQIKVPAFQSGLIIVRPSGLQDEPSTEYNYPVKTLAVAREEVQSKLEVEPQQVLVGDQVSIRAVGLDAGQVASLRVSGQDQFGNDWSSEASFRADAAGTIDTSRDSPLEGSYKGVDQAGLFWSMAVNQTGQMVSPFPVIHTLKVTLSVDGREVESQTIQRTGQIDLVKDNLTVPIVGVFIRPQELTEPTPAIIVLGGSEGGYNEGWATLIASKTRMPTLALAYFGAEGLPPTLENVSLETISSAIDWLNQHPVVAKDRIGVVGASRGGELAMLASSIFPEIKAVVGYTPSGVIWSGIGEDPEAPAWTYQGKAFPYLLMMESEEQDRLFLEAQRNGTPYLDAPSFIYSLEMQRDRIPEATIPVENSQAAFLLIGNPGDGVWPSDILSQIAIDRLRAQDHPRSYQLLSYDQGGHMLVPYPYYPTTMRQFYLPTVNIWEGLGGTAEGAAKAAEDSWPRVVEFLKRELRR